MAQRTTYTFRRLKDIYGSHGLAKTVKYLARRLSRVFYVNEADCIMVKRLDEVPHVGEDRLELVPIETNQGRLHLHEFARKHVSPKMRRYLNSYLRGGFRGFVGLIDEEVIGYVWWVDNRTDRPHPDLILHEILLDDVSAYGFSLLIAPEFRGRGISTEFLLKLLSELRELGYKQAWGFFAADNGPARWLFAVTGHEVVDTRSVRKLFSRIVVSNRRVLIMNSPRESGEGFGYRLVLSFRGDAGHDLIPPGNPNRG